MAGGSPKPFFHTPEYIMGCGAVPHFSLLYEPRLRSLDVVNTDARVVLLATVSRLVDHTRRIMDATALVEPNAGCWHITHAAPGRGRRLSSILPSGTSFEASPCRYAILGRRVSSRPARGSAARARSARNGALELGEWLHARRSATEQHFLVERALGTDRIASVPA